MPEAWFRLHPSFAPLIPAYRRRGRQHLTFRESPSAKHLIEGLGIPHTEVGEVVTNGRPVGLGYHVADGDRIDVLPVRRLTGDPRDGPGPCFALDQHLGRLAALLRILGFDCLYRNDVQDGELTRWAAGEERILLTRDRALLMRKAVERGYWVRRVEPPAQLEEVTLRFGLLEGMQPFRRCPRCNQLLQAVDKATVLDELEPLTRRYYDDFRRCPGCGQVYWAGSHVECLSERVAALRRALRWSDARRG
jgi:uncharacterized protein with PIN domain